MLDGLFELGEIITTPGAIAVLREIGMPDLEAGRLLARHHHGDWGDINPHEAKRNSGNLKEGLIESAYGQGSKRLYVITAADRSSTTIKAAKEVV